MRAITLRNLPPEVQLAVAKRAEKEGSLNRAVIKLLEESIGAKDNGKPRKHRDASHLAGTWSKRQYDRFNKHLAMQRKIDREMWKK